MTNDTDYKICNMCGSLVDSNSIFNIKGEELCKSCVEKKLEQKNNISTIGTFMCSLIPGVGHIFLGIKEKGLFLLSSFLINILLFISSMGIYEIFWRFQPFEIISVLLIILTPILDIAIYLYSFFDANITRKYIENNMYIEGYVDKLAHKVFNRKNKKYLQEKVIDKRLQ